MSDDIQCPNCGRSIKEDRTSCEWCGNDLVDPQDTSDPAEVDSSDMTVEELRSLGYVDQAHGGLHRLAPVIFVAVGIPVGIIMTVTVGLALGIALGLLGGGIGVWMVERGRRSF